MVVEVVVGVVLVLDAVGEVGSISSICALGVHFTICLAPSTVSRRVGGLVCERVSKRLSEYQ